MGNKRMSDTSREKTEYGPAMPDGEEAENRTEAVSEGVLAEIFPKLMKDSSHRFDE
jgi:hypothetical protein